MKILSKGILKIGLLLLSFNFTNSSLETALRVDNALNQLDVASDNYEKNRKRDQDLQLEAMLLIDSYNVILECVKNKEYIKLKTIYDKMYVDSNIKRPTKDQIEECRKIIEDHIQETKIKISDAKKSHSYLKKIIINSLALGSSITCFGAMFIYGENKIKTNPGVIHNFQQRYENYLAKYAIDTSAMLGLPITAILLLKFICDLFAGPNIETIQKMNSLLLLFEQLSEAKQ